MSSLLHSSPLAPLAPCPLTPLPPCPSPLLLFSPSIFHPSYLPPFNRLPPPPLFPPHPQVIEGSYHPDYLYHNALHAADVAQTTLSMIVGDRLHQALDREELLALVLTAAGHDADHPGE